MSGGSGAVPGLSGSDWAGEGADRLEAMLAPVDDPVAAFANLHRATRPGGRLAVAVWLPRDASEFQSLAVDVAMRVAADRGVELQPPGPDEGPFAYGIADHTRPILEAAGWRDVALVRHDLTLYLGGAGTTPEEAVEMGRRFGPLAMVLDGAPPEVVDPVLAEFMEELRRRWDGTGIPLQAAIAVVSARH